MRWLQRGAGYALLGVFAMTAQIASGNPATATLDGQWGGDRLQLVIDPNGGRVETDCASGAIVGPLKLAKNGKFVAFGTFEQYRGGPQRADEPQPAVNARFSGEVKEGVMKLEILPAGASAPQVFNLRKGARIKLVRCY